MGLSSQSVQWISRQASSVADLRMDASVRGAKAEGQIPRLIHRDAAHPTPGRVRLIRALLPDRDGSVGDVFQFDPADACDPARAHGKIHYDGFVRRRRGAKIPI